MIMVTKLSFLDINVVWKRLKNTDFIDFFSSLLASYPYIV